MVAGSHRKKNNEMSTTRVCQGPWGPLSRGGDSRKGSFRVPCGKPQDVAGRQELERSCSLGARIQVEAATVEVDRRLVVLSIPVAAGHQRDRLDLAVDASCACPRLPAGAPPACGGMVLPSAPGFRRIPIADRSRQSVGCPACGSGDHRTRGCSGALELQAYRESRQDPAVQRRESGARVRPDRDSHPEGGVG